jgi:hypothetical protein
MINDEPTIERLLDLGVYAIMTARACFSRSSAETDTQVPERECVVARIP